MAIDYDICIIGSGAGGGPVAYSLARAGYSVLILEQGFFPRNQDFYKDEMATALRKIYTPQPQDEPHVIEFPDANSQWKTNLTTKLNWNFWNGNMVGGSSNLMSGFFHRMQPQDFRLLSEYGPIQDANIVDWPISYSDLEPYYTAVESIVGISGTVANTTDPTLRSTANFPLPPTLEHPVTNWLDTACDQLGLVPLKVPRAILSRPTLGRNSCEYSGYCGSFGCSSGAKGSSRVAFILPALATGNCQVRPHSKVQRLHSNTQGKITEVEYIDATGTKQSVTAKIYVIACQAIETCRLLLLSTGPAFPYGLANNQQQVGKNLIFSGGGTGSGKFVYADLSPERAAQLRVMGPFINRALDTWYTISDTKLAPGRHKGGIIEFMLNHPNVVKKADRVKWDSQGKLRWGLELKRHLENTFTTSRSLHFEVFNDWLPNANCQVILDSQTKDRWGTPVARVRIGYHPWDLKVGNFLAQKAQLLLTQLGAKHIHSTITGSPPPNLQAGGCRFGVDPKQSVLNPNCQAHEVDNLYITDGSFMPTGGSVPYTWTIYANALRVAAHIANHISKSSGVPLERPRLHSHAGV